MKIMKLLCSNITNDNEYREYVRTRIILSVIIAVLGAIALFVAMFANKIFNISIDDHQMGYYCGLGTGLIVAGIALAIKFGMLLKNQDKLKKQRIKETDERTQSIKTKALVIAGLILLASIYIIGIIGGLYYPILTRLLLIPVAIFLVSYTIAFKVYSSKS